MRVYYNFFRKRPCQAEGCTTITESPSHRQYCDEHAPANKVRAKAAWKAGEKKATIRRQQELLTTTTKPFTIAREGKVYLTRSGKTARIFAANPTMADGRIDGHKRHTCWWAKTGKSAGTNIHGEQKHPGWDLVAEIVKKDV